MTVYILKINIFFNRNIDWKISHIRIFCLNYKDTAPPNQAALLHRLCKHSLLRNTEIACRLALQNWSSSGHSIFHWAIPIRGRKRISVVIFCGIPCLVPLFSDIYTSTLVSSFYYGMLSSLLWSSNSSVLPMLTPLFFRGIESLASVEQLFFRRKNLVLSIELRLESLAEISIWGTVCFNDTMALNSLLVEILSMLLWVAVWDNMKWAAGELEMELAVLVEKRDWVCEILL